jgi:acyl-CoA dehydrogenase
MAHPFYTADHEAFRDQVRRFVAREIEPFATQWDEAEEFPRELYRKAAAIGLLGLGFPEGYGGIPADRFMWIIATQELARHGAGGINASLMSHAIGAPPIVAAGSEALKARLLPGIFAGERIAALAITEPGGGSDVANLRTTARRDGDHYVVNGEKTFITSGMRADCYTVAVRTGGEGPGGVSLLVIERDAPGFTRTPLKKMGWWASDTATLHFDDVRVPAGNLLGQEGAGFKIIMRNFNHERLTMAAGCIAMARVCLDEARAYAAQRVTFGKKLTQHQVIRPTLRHEKP